MHRHATFIAKRCEMFYDEVPTLPNARYHHSILYAVSIEIAKGKGMLVPHPYPSWVLEN